MPLKVFTRLIKHTLLFEEFEGTFNGAVLSLVCLGPITPAVAIILFPFAFVAVIYTSDTYSFSFDVKFSSTVLNK